MFDQTTEPILGSEGDRLSCNYYEQYQYYPLIISEPTTKHVFVAWLRPGTVHASLGADDDLLRVVAALRKQRPDIRIHVRADAGFGLPLMYEVCEQNDLTHTFGFATNARLKKLTDELLTQKHHYLGDRGGFLLRFWRGCITRLLTWLPISRLCVVGQSPISAFDDAMSRGILTLDGDSDDAANSAFRILWFIVHCMASPKDGYFQSSVFREI